MELKENLEGKKTDNLEATSASDTIDVEQEQAPELNSSPVPTVEEEQDANLTPVENPEAPIEEPAPVESENVNVTPTPVVEEQVHEENGVTEAPALRTYTQEEYQNGLNDIAGKTRIETREKTFKYIYDRYGVNDEAGLDELIGNAQRYDSLQEQYDTDKKGWKEQSSLRDQELADIKEQVALMQSGIDKNRYEDAKYILKGKGLDVNLENINAELASHPEWKNEVPQTTNPNFAKVSDGATIEPQTTEPVSKLSVLGNEPTPKNGASEEEDFVLGRMFKV